MVRHYAAVGAIEQMIVAIVEQSAQRRGACTADTRERSGEYRPAGSSFDCKYGTLQQCKPESLREQGAFNAYIPKDVQRHAQQPGHHHVEHPNTLMQKAKYSESLTQPTSSEIDALHKTALKAALREIKGDEAWNIFDCKDYRR